MGLERRKTTNKLFGGSKLNVPGQGIYAIKKSPSEQVVIKSQNERPPTRPTPTPSVTTTVTPTSSVTPTVTPTPTMTQTQTPTVTPTMTQTQTPTVTPTMTQTQTSTPTMTQTQTPTMTQTPTPSITQTPTITPTPTPTPTIAGLDPLSLNPLVYYQTYDTTFLMPSSPISGDSILTMYKYNTSGETATGTTGCVATWDALNGKNILYFPGNNGGCWPPPCVGNCASEYYATDDINFMHKTGFSYTIYCVAKPFSGYMFSDLEQSNSYSESLYIDSNFDVRLRVTTGTFSPLTMFDLIIENNGNQSTIENKGLRIFSVRADDPGTIIIGTAATAYVNGIETNSTALTNQSSDNSNSLTFRIGSVDLDPGSESYKGYLAELIIFNTMHSITDHNNIILFLKNRWGIT